VHAVGFFTVIDCYTISMTSMSKDQHFHAALEAVRVSCQVARAVQRDLERVRQIAKDDKSPVTVADFAVQAVVAMILNEQLGDSLIVGEEHTRALRTPEQAAVLHAVVEAVRLVRPGVTPDEVLAAIDACNHEATGEAYWALDPIDGTKGFLRGQQYAIALGRIESGEVMLGVMGCPNLPLDQNAPLDHADAHGSIYSATRGGGAWEHPVLPSPSGRGAGGEGPRRIHTARFDGARPIRACESVEAAHSKQDIASRILDEVARLTEPGLPTRKVGVPQPARLDSQSKYAVVARGQADVYLRVPTSRTYIEKIWDHAAGAIIATEAGAIVSDITGSPLDFSHGRLLSANRGIICAVPGVHERIVEAADRIGFEAAV
jgi:3'(2'), 5'-bisphosphate nucleotidase